MKKRAKHDAAAAAVEDDVDSAIVREACATYRAAVPASFDLAAFKSHLQSLPSRVLSASPLPGIVLVAWSTKKPVVLHFRAPSLVHVTSLHAANASISAEVELAVEIPKACLGAKDYCDYVYADKRSLYLAVIAESLLAQGCKVDVNDAHGGAAVELVVRTPDAATVRIAACLPADAFPALAPSRGVVRDRRPGGFALGDVPTPRVVASLAGDARLVAVKHDVAAACARNPALADAAVLVQVWMARHSVLGVPPIVPLARLAATGGAAPGASALQLFRAALAFLAALKGAKVNCTAATAAAPTGFAVPCVLDPSGAFDLAPWVSASALDALARHAGFALAALLRGRGLAGVLSAPLSLPRVVDVLVRIPVPAPPQGCAPRAGDESEERAMCDAPWAVVCCDALEALVRAGLVATGRATAALVCAAPAQSHAASAPPPPRAVIVGLVLDASKAFRKVDRGPPAEDAVAAGVFRALFGSRAELRRFKDGAIVEAAVWEDVPRQRVPGFIVEFLAQRAPLQGGAVALGLELADTEAPRLAALAAFSRLDAALRALKSVPLRVASVAPASARLRCGGDGGGRIDVALRLEASSKWPAEPEARAQAATALAIAMARELEAGDATLSVGAGRGFLDVRTGDGLFFRVHVGGSMQAEAELHGHLAALAAAGGGEAMGLATRLALRWVAGHRLGSQLGVEAVELLVASLFLPAAPLPPPAAAMPGFLRFLDLLAGFPWAAEPLLAFDASEDAARRAREAFAEQRSRGLAPPMSILTGAEPQWRPRWTEATAPSPEGLARARRLAAQSLALLEALCERATPRDSALWQAAFTSGTKDYDAVLVLAPLPPQLQPGRPMQRRRYKNVGDIEVDERALLARDLKARFGGLADFFVGRDAVGVVFKPAQPVAFRVAASLAALPCQGDGGVLVNRAEVVDECARIAKGLVVAVELVNM